MELSEMTARELVAVHDGRCAPDRRIDGPWKRSKGELIDQIRALGTAENGETPRQVTAEPGRDDHATVGATVAELLMDPVLGYADIVLGVMERFPDANTTARSVASVASALRRRGVDVPMRRGKRPEG